MPTTGKTKSLTEEAPAQFPKKMIESVTLHERSRELDHNPSNYSDTVSSASLMGRLRRIQANVPGQHEMSNHSQKGNRLNNGTMEREQQSLRGRKFPYKPPSRGPRSEYNKSLAGPTFMTARDHLDKEDSRKGRGSKRRQG